MLMISMYRFINTALFTGKGDEMRLEDMPFDGDVTTRPSEETVKAMEGLLAKLEGKSNDTGEEKAAPAVKVPRFDRVAHGA